MLDEIRCLLDQFKGIYENKLSAVENNTTLTNEEILRVKLGILETYVTDLAEQNLNLIETCAILQTETENRVNILEKLLEKTTEKSQDYVRAINKYQKLTSQNPHQIKSLEEENAFLVRKISNLIHVINHAKSTGCLDFTNTELDVGDLYSPICKSSIREFNYQEDLKEIYYEERGKSILDLPSALSPSVISLNCSYSGTTDKEVLVKRLQVDIKILDRKYNEKNSQLLLKDATIASLQSEISQLKHELILKENECAIHLHDLHVKDHQREEITNVEFDEKLLNWPGISSQVRLMSRDKSLSDESELMVGDEEEKIRKIENKFQIELNETLNELETYKQEVEKLKEEIRSLDASAQETRFILTQEIAEKHDTIKSLRHDYTEQTEHHKEIVQQLVLKCEVIKGLRKELKRVEENVESRELDLAKRKEELDIQQQLLVKQTTEIENQKITIANLQEALVQSKRGVNGTNNNNNRISNGSNAKNNNDVIDI